MNRNRIRAVARRRKQPTASPSDKPVKMRPRWRIGILAAALLFVLAIFFYTGGLTRLSNHLAETAIARHDLSAAKGWLDTSERFSPRDPYRFFLAARIARREGDLPQMSADLRRALDHGFDPERVRREHLLGRAQTGRLEGIEAEINEWLLEGGSEVPEISNAYANGLATQLRLYAAMEVLGAWQQDYPDDPVPFYRMGRIHEHADRFDEAKASYRAAIALDDDYLPACYSLGRLLLDEKKPKEAIALFERCLAVPNPAAARVGIARCLIEMGETARAAKLLYEVMEQDPGTIHASYRTFGETPEQFVAATELGKLEANAGNFEEAKKLLDLAINEHPRDLAARYSRAVALRGLGRREQAESEFQHVQAVQQALERVEELKNRVNRAPEDTEARIAIGKLFLEHGSERTGLFWLRSVLVYDSQNAKAHEELARYYESQAPESPQYAQLAREHRQRAPAGKAD